LVVCGRKEFINKSIQAKSGMEVKAWMRRLMAVLEGTTGLSLKLIYGLG